MEPHFQRRIEDVDGKICAAGSKWIAGYHSRLVKGPGIVIGRKGSAGKNWFDTDFGQLIQLSCPP